MSETQQQSMTKGQLSDFVLSVWKDAGLDGLQEKLQALQETGLGIDARMAELETKGSGGYRRGGGWIPGQGGDLRRPDRPVDSEVGYPISRADHGTPRLRCPEYPEVDRGCRRWMDW
jgi:hypothetical protein